jgi:uncharacterized membrane protein
MAAFETAASRDTRGALGSVTALWINSILMLLFGYLMDVRVLYWWQSVDYSATAAALAILGAIPIGLMGFAIGRHQTDLKMAWIPAVPSLALVALFGPYLSFGADWVMALLGISLVTGALTSIVVQQFSTKRWPYALAMAGGFASIMWMLYLRGFVGALWLLRLIGAMMNDNWN